MNPNVICTFVVTVRNTKTKEGGFKIIQAEETLLR